MNERFKKLTILHSNDLHGDFLAENVDNKLVGGVSMLSGYISEVRKTEPNTLYCVAGDMFRGSVIDSEYQGLSTIELMNMLSPDVVTIGNHETDYGLAHLLFIEKCANFPIINANLHITMNNQRLFRPYEIIKVDGMKILFIGIITEDVIANTKGQGIISSFININEAAEEVGRICNSFRGIDIDFTVLLTHIGYDEDIKLAKQLDPDWGVDVIIGGHSHTFMKEPTKVNDILIVQAGTGTDQIGRFDIVVDTDNNCIDSYTWNAVDINEDNCPRDEKIETLINKLKEETDLKYERVLTRFNDEYTHPSRHMQTELGGIFADQIKDALGVQVALLASGSIRVKSLGPIVTVKDLMNAFPFNDKVYQMIITGKQLRTMLSYIYRKEAWGAESHTEFYQLSEGLKVEYSKAKQKIVSLKYHDEEVQDERHFTLALQGYHFLNIKECFGIESSEVQENQKARVVCTSDHDLLEEHLSSGIRISKPKEERLIFVD